MRNTRLTIGSVPATPSPTTGAAPGPPQWPLSPPPGPQFQSPALASPHSPSGPVVDPALQDQPTERATSLAEEVDLQLEGEKRTKEDHYTHLGRGDGRWHEGVTPYFAILQTGWRLKNVTRRLSKQEEAAMSKFNGLLARFPEIEETLDTVGFAAVAPFAKALEHGRQYARAEDNNHVKDLIDDFIKPEGRLPLKPKRGFHHELCAYLLAPWTVDIYDPIVRREYKDGVRYLISGDFGPLLYKDEVVNTSKRFEGWLQGRILMKVGLMIAFGKAAAKAEDPSRRRSSGIAHIYRKYEVTIEFIAYAAVLAHFALTDTEILQVDAPNSPFSYTDFYNAIVVIFNSRSESFKQEVLWEWNKFIYGDKGGLSTKNIADGSSGLAENTPASIMFNMPEGVE